MDASELKQQSQHPPSYLDSKRIKLSDCNEKIEFGDMCDDAIEMILNYLELADLINVSATDDRIRNIAGSVFSRKYGNHLISIKTYETLFFDLLYHQEFFAKNPIARICDAIDDVIDDPIVCYRLLRNLGKYIKFLRVKSKIVPKHYPRNSHLLHIDDFVESPWKHVMEYVSKYCADSLESLELIRHPLSHLNNPFPSLQILLLHHPIIIETAELAPNVHTLYIDGLDLTVKLDRYFPNLETVKIRVASSEDVNLFISFLKMNQRIKYLMLLIEIDGYIDLILSTISENLIQLKTFKLALNYDPEKDVLGISQVYKFNTVNKFHFFHNFNQNLFLQIDKCEFNNLEKLILLNIAEYLPRYQLWAPFIVRHNIKLRKLKLTDLMKDYVNINNYLTEFPMLLATLFELKEITLSGQPESINIIFTNILQSNWEPVLRREGGEKVKFRRITGEGIE